MDTEGWFGRASHPVRPRSRVSFASVNLPPKHKASPQSTHIFLPKVQRMLSDIKALYVRMTHPVIHFFVVDIIHDFVMVKQGMHITGSVRRPIDTRAPVGILS